MAMIKASVILHILKTTLKLIEKSEFNVNELSALFNCVLNLVADKAQRKVVVPNGLDLNAWINDPPSDSEDESITTSSYYDNKDLFYGDNGENYNSNLYSGVTLSYQKSKKYIGLTAEELEKQRESRKQSEQMNPFYLKDSKKPKVTQTTETTLDTINGNDRIESTLSQGTNVTRKKSKPDDESSKKGKKSLKKSNITVIDDNDDDIYRIAKVTRGGELPEGATESGNEDNDYDVIVGKNKKYDPHRALNIDLSEKPIQSIPISPPPLTSQLKEPVPKQEYSINPNPSIAQLDVTFLVKNRTLFPHSQNYTHIYFSINAISFSQKLKTTLTYSINKSNIIETDRIEFKLNLPCSQYLRRKTIDSPSVILHILKTTLKLIEKSEFNVNELSVLFDCVLNPGAAKAQRKVVVPNSLDLNAWINDPSSDSADELITISSHYDNKDLFYGDNGENSNSNLYSGVTLSYQKSKKYIEPTAEELEKQRESRKQRNKSSKNSNITVIDDNDDDIYRIAKVTCGGELPEGTTESGNEDNDHDVIVGKNKKYDPHRALNIDLSEKPIQSIPTSPPLLTSQLKEPVPKQVETPPILTGKPKKCKKKKIIEKQEQSSTLKSKHKRERSDYKELLSPADEEENCPTSSPPPSAIAKKPKKKNHRQKQTTSIGHYDR
ncbi:unnamed protein product [Rotaria sordida]|uniref:AP-3 complex subunit delta domain-containing protein n=1 Tax=Rotaria sordida TaxID=392033 RepID=A0A815PNE6_9BILA|nr:unnamed protein product [Rotaria sordida]